MPRVLGFILVLLVSTVSACRSESPTGREITVEDVWARPALAMQNMSDGSSDASVGMAHSQSGTGGVFFTVVNRGRDADRLIGVRTEVADVAEIHETKMEGDVAMMQLLPDGLAIPAEGEVTLKPGGYHIMLIGLKQNLEQGDTFSVVLEFEKSGMITVEAQVRQP